MKILITTIALLTSLPSFCVTFKIIGPCSEKPLAESKLKINDSMVNLGKLTIDYLIEKNIPYSGDEQAISSINNSPTGDQAIEILSDIELRAYGWCYTINNLLPEKTPNDILINNNNDIIIWFYAFSSYIKGEWKNYCTPAYTIQNSKFCSQK